MLEEIVRTNALGTLLCCRAAIRLMQKQPRGGCAPGPQLPPTPSRSTLLCTYSLACAPLTQPALRRLLAQARFQP